MPKLRQVPKFCHNSKLVNSVTLWGRQRVLVLQMTKPNTSQKRAEKTRLSDDRRSQSLHAFSQAKLDDDVIIVPTRQAAPTISLSGFLLLVASFFLFKAGCIAWIGAEDYVASIKYLKSGSVFEQAAAFVMAPDILSQFMANQMAVVLR